MKRTIFFTFIFIVNLLKAQTVYTDVYVGDFPISIVLIDNYLYVGEFSSGEVSRIDLTDSNPVPETVATGWTVAQGPWKMIYDEQNNDIYVGSFTEVRKVDLDASVPMVSEAFSATGISEGLTINNNILYKATNGSLHTIDLSVGPASYTSIYTDATGNMGDLTFYNNELYYASDTDGSGVRNAIYKIDLSASSLSQELVIDTGVTGGTIQKMHVVDDFMYLSVEAPGGHLLGRINLKDAVLPIADFTTVLSGYSGAMLGIVNLGNTFYGTLGTQVIVTFQDQTLSVGDFSVQNPIRIYPNPVKDNLFIDNFDSKNQEIEIYTMQGKKILNRSNVVSESVNVSSIPQGLYFMKVKSDTKETTLRFVKR
ncbi:T9SS type A sorting domain-containing protein [Aquimarina litoralis]|uniref:T9SS type A sorting domain-containing protein n=1 Tax=Aquimarina litoralis TaxID=584605 RepID=UPI001C575A19|nr:T9SS type A sorting domain-containing protein [Aquimarina litoralis]